VVVVMVVMVVMVVVDVVGCWVWRRGEPGECEVATKQQHASSTRSKKWQT